MGKSTQQSPTGFTNGMGKNLGMVNGNGHTNGMVNGNGHTNGMVNGMGRKSGMVNGNGHTNGMVNGSGHTNGIRNTNNSNLNKIDFREKKGVSKPTILIVAFILLSSIILSGFLISNDMNIIKTQVDGDYREWEDMNDIGFAKLGIIQEGNKILFGLERDNILKGKDNITESYLFFINDHKSQDGFYLGYDTYEYYIDIYGKDNEINQARGFQFDEVRENNDWNGFTSRYSPYSISSANDNSMIEFEIHSLMLGHNSFENMSLLVFHYDTGGAYEYSQILDINKNITSTKVDNTRASMTINYRHIFEKNELHIDTGKSLAYSSIPYEIRIIQEIARTTEYKFEPSPIENKTIENITIESTIPELQFKEMGTKIVIEYKFYDPDIIEQCGGNIINSTVDVNLTDDGFILYDFNRTVKSMKITGDINTTVVGDITRAGTIDISDSSLPSPEPTGSISTMKANEYDVTEQGIIVDGDLDEYFWGRIPTDQYYVDQTYDMKIWTVRNSTHVFVGVRSLADDVSNANDWNCIYFDTDNDETTTPDVDDKRIEITGADAITYYEGDGSVWQSTTLPTGWDAGVSMFTVGSSTVRTYEYVVPISDLDENDQFNSVNTTIGLGIHNVDDRSPPKANAWHLWYPDNYYAGETPTTQYMDKPDTWADLEFGDDFTGTEFTDYDMFSPVTSDAITIDGDLDESAWTSTAHDWTITCNGYEADLYIMKDTTYLYVGWYSKNYDTLSENDFCQIYFDTDYDGTVDPDAGDKLMQIGDDNATAYFYGTGTAWAGDTMPTNWDGSNGVTTGNISWEARFTLSELDTNGNFGADDEKIGFGMVVGHISTTPSYTMAWPDACEENFEMSRYKYHPESFGDLIYSEIPEFNEVAPLIFFMLFIGAIFTIKRRGKEDEYK